MALENVLPAQEKQRKGGMTKEEMIQSSRNIMPSNQNSEGLISLAEIILELNNKFIPHESQARIGRAILHEGAKKVMAVCGRSYGKSRISSYLNVRLAMETPFATNYIFLPFLTQGKEVYWTPRILQQIIPDGIS